MQEYNSIIGNLLKAIDRRNFKSLVTKHKGEYYSKKLSCWEQFVAIFIGQILKNCNSLRDIEDFLLCNSNQWHNLGINNKISRSTLSYANNTKSYKIYEDLFYYLLKKCNTFNANQKEYIKIIDSSPIYLNLNLFTWSEETIRIHGIKLHLVYDLNDSIPTYFEFSGAKTEDIEVAKKLEIQPNTTYVMDRGYMDFNWWNEIDEKGAYFVTRLKRNNAIIELSEIEKIDEQVSSQLIKLKRKKLNSGKNNMSEKVLRRVIVQRENNTPLVIVSNDLNRSPKEIAELYKQRWQIELFFKWIKQNLKLEKFLGRSENAVKTQICIALCAFLVIHEAQELKAYISEICNYFSESKFLKMINNHIFKTIKPINRKRSRDNPWQLKLIFD